MPTEVLYRKWRPQRFADVAGQDVVTRTLINAIAGERVSHAYLFAGPRGTGKTTMARLLAKAINCEQNAKGKAKKPGEPCNSCPACQAVADGNAVDLIEIDGASTRGIDDIRALREHAGYLPMAGMDAHKVYLIDEVHMLTEAAFNALLKTLEEPPPHIVFILATTDVHKVPATIVSRCQRHEFNRIPLSAMVARLEYVCSQEDLDVPAEGLQLIGRAATGSLRDAINLLEQVCDSYGSSLSVEAVREGLGLIDDERASALALQALEGDLAAGLDTIASVRDDGLDLRQFQKEVVLRLRELLHMKAGAATDSRWTPEQANDMKSSIEDISRARLVQALRAFGQADLRADPLSPLPLELALADASAVPQQASVPDNVTALRPPPVPRESVSQRTTSGSPDASPAVRPESPTQAPRERVPAELRKDLGSASAEDIARMLGSKKPVIPAAVEDEQPEAKVETPSPARAASNGMHIVSTAGGTIDLDTFIDEKLRPLAKQRQMKLDALLNGSCRAMSFEGGVLTLGFFMDAHHKKTVEQPTTRKIYEELASQILGEPVTIQCTLAARPARPIKSPLVQHAVENRGAKIVSGSEEP